MPTAWYGGYLPGLPDICVGKWPEELGNSERWKLWIVRSPDERTALEAALDRPVPRLGQALDFSAGPDAAARRVFDDDDYVALYSPVESGWPWLTLVSVTMAPADAAHIGAARGRYTWDADEDEAAAVARLARLRASMPVVDVRMPDRRGQN